MLSFNDILEGKSLTSISGGYKFPSKVVNIAAPKVMIKGGDLLNGKKD
jgi:hypothetical protein